jgi:carboxymethylenebutenolidase
MIEQDVVVTTKYGRMPAFAACPDGPGTYPGVIIYMDAPGIREELRQIARRVAKHGYFCLLPDMYYRLGTLRFDIPRRNDAMSVVIRGAMNHLTNAMVADDTGGLLAFLDGQDRVAPGKVGCVGYCMSGCFVTTVAARFPLRIASAASLYGVNIVTDKEDSPHLLVGEIKGEMYYGFASTDPSVPEHVIPTLRSALTKAKTKHEIEVFPDSHHGFCFPERPDFNHHAAEGAWAKLTALWERTLK